MKRFVLIKNKASVRRSIREGIFVEDVESFCCSLRQIHLPLHLAKSQVLLSDKRYRVKGEKSDVLCRISKRNSGSISSSFAPKPSHA